MASIIEKDEEKNLKPKVEPNLNQMAQRAQNLSKLKNFYDEMDFHPEQRFSITKSLSNWLFHQKIQILFKKEQEGAVDLKTTRLYLTKVSGETYEANIIDHFM